MKTSVSMKSKSTTMPISQLAQQFWCIRRRVSAMRRASASTRETLKLAAASVRSSVALSVASARCAASEFCLSRATSSAVSSSSAPCARRCISIAAWSDALASSPATLPAIRRRAVCRPAPSATTPLAAAAAESADAAPNRRARRSSSPRGCSSAPSAPPGSSSSSAVARAAAARATARRGGTAPNGAGRSASRSSSRSRIRRRQSSAWAAESASPSRLTRRWSACSPRRCARSSSRSRSRSGAKASCSVQRSRRSRFTAATSTVSKPSTAAMDPFTVSSNPDLGAIFARPVRHCCCRPRPTVRRALACRRRHGVLLGGRALEEWQGAGEPPICRHEPHPHRGALRGLPEADRHRQQAAHLRGDGQGALRLPAGGVALLPDDHKQAVQHHRGPRDPPPAHKASARVLPRH
mmetsp:Transcript_2737/g.6633  ORF Transcript_2737/g.6633 Transcript_2737/m.6633 type:complete len:410 (+) Transcript_2737:80-1309(+)